MKITICGSISFFNKMKKIKRELEDLEIFDHIYMPVGFGKDSQKVKNDLSIEEDTARKKKFDLINIHYEKIMKSGAILVVNYMKNKEKYYIGGNTFLEMGFAHVNNRDIFVMNPIPDMTYKAELDAMMPIDINENVKRIREYYRNLPKVFVASNSRIKKDSVSLGLRSIGYKSYVRGFNIGSGISNQPIGFDEMMKGASNRIEKLQRKVKEYSYLVSIESGMIPFKKSERYIDLGLCIMQDKKGRREICLSQGIEIPSKTAKKVIAEKKELGPYLQKLSGMKEKDAAFYFSSGKLTRQKLLEQSVAYAYSRFI